MSDTRNRSLSTGLRRRQLLTGLALSPLLLSARASAAPERGIVGQAAPELDMAMWLDAKGQPDGHFSIMENRSRFIVLKFWQSWCPGCHSHGLPALKEISTTLADDDRFAFAAVQTTFEGFTTNTEDKVSEIQERYELAVPVGHASPATDGSHLPPTMVDYRTGGTPWFIVIEKGGNVVFNDFRLSAERFLSWAETLA